MPAPPIIVAHRGLHHAHPENSLAAFRAAWEAGFDWCECDVRLTSCLVPIVIHDAELDRTTTRVGRVDQVSWSNVTSARLRGGDGVPTGEPVPKLIDVLPPRASSRRMLIEIKPDPRPQVVQAVVGLVVGHADAVEVQSFDAAIAHQVHRLCPALRVRLLTEELEVARRAHEGPWTGVSVQHKLLDGELVDRLRRAGKSVAAWTVNESDDICRVLVLGVDMIITDQPQRVREAMASAG